MQPLRLRPDTLALTAVLALLTALGPLSTDMYLPSLPAITQELRTTTSGTQLTLSAFLAGFAVGQLFYGPVADKIGRKPVLLFGLGLFILASVACTLADSIEMLVAGRFAQALGASGPIVLARTVVRDLYEGARAGRELSRMGTIMGVVPALAPILGGVIHEISGWRTTFGVTVVIGLLLFATVATGLPETIRQKNPAPLSIANVIRGFRDLLAHRSYRVYIALAALTYGGLFAFISGSSFVLQGRYGLGEIPYALSFAVMVVGYIAGTLLAQRVVGKRGLDGTIALGVAAQAAGGLAMLGLNLIGTGFSAEVTLPMALYTLGVGLTLPQVMASAMTPFPMKAGAASSLLGIVQMSFAAIVGIGLGLALDLSDLALPLTIATLGLAALALFRLSAGARAA
jgi:DHA1 family bicyclomycin/chloramphenicol resistance-like MFS transporter